MMSRKECELFFSEQLGRSEKNGRIISIKRKRHFAGSLIPYYCVVGMEKEAFLAYCKERCKDCHENDEAEDQEEEQPTIFEILKTLAGCGRIEKVVRIFNGKTIVMNAPQGNPIFFVFVQSTPETAFSNQVHINIGNTCDFTIKTTYDWKKGMALTLEEK